MSVGALLFVCPVTGGEIRTDFEVDQQTIDQTKSIEVPVQCPHCRTVHSFRVEEGRLDSGHAAEGPISWGAALRRPD